jgi:hypothetical protein
MSGCGVNRRITRSNAPNRFPGIKAMAFFVGICLHLLHMCLRMHRMQNAAECNVTWEHFRDNNNDEVNGWVSCHLHTISLIFDHVQIDFGCVILIVAAATHGYFISTCYKTSHSSSQNKMAWYRNEFTLTVFRIYSPAHALMWMVTAPTNCLLVIITMIILSKQVGSHWACLRVSSRSPNAFRWVS